MFKTSMYIKKMIVFVLFLIK